MKTLYRKATALAYLFDFTQSREIFNAIEFGDELIENLVDQLER